MNEEKKGTNIFAIVALICGLLATIGAFIPGVSYFAWIIGVLGIIFGALGMKKSKQLGSGNGLAIAGLVLGIIGTVIGFIGFMCVTICIGIASVPTTTSAILFL